MITLQSSDKKDTIGAVLAGGLSSRMGEDKALLSIHATSMLQRTIDILLATSVREVVVSRNDNAINHIADIIPHKGPLSGIHSIATQFPECNVMVLPVDLPLLDASTVQVLIDHGEKTLQNVRFKGDNLPLYIHNTPRFREVIEHTLNDTTRFSVQGLCAHFPLLELINPTQQSMFNTNTPQQWQYAKRQMALSSKSRANSPIAKQRNAPV